MKCEQANQIDLVDYLNTIGFNPQKIIREDHWYVSPFRNEKHASFKVNKNKNFWYDHGLGKGGTLVDFAMEFYHCKISEALQKISFFHQQKSFQNNAKRLPLQSLGNKFFNQIETTETAIRIIAANLPIQDPMLCRYLEQRKIEKGIADRYCYEVQFTNAGKEKIYKAIGFKNNAGGYELRNQYFKAGSSPKYVSYFDNKANKLTVFEGFFDFMSYQSIHKNEQQELTNFLILNSLSFFARSLLLMGKHEAIHLYLDNDEAGRKCTSLAQKRSPAFKDESKLYQGYKDLNEWLMNFEKKRRQKLSLKH